MSLPAFPTSRLRVICTSDTHNDNPTAQVPDGDIFIHGGDIVDRGSNIEQYQAALDWISNLPHKIKILVGGNGDVELDKATPKFKAEILDLFVSEEIKAKGVVYLDRETRVIGYVEENGKKKAIKAYGNPLQPEFSGNKYPFTYYPHPHQDAWDSWTTAPGADDEVQIWVMHGPPFERLDNANVPGLVGCPIQAQRIAEAKPLLVVFGHFHFSWGVERVRWTADGSEIAEILTLSEERKEIEESDRPVKRDFDFSDNTEEHGKETQSTETIFVNASWMTTKKRQVELRNHPIAVTISL
jgi:Calcineurin-like phosphoesterase